MKLNIKTAYLISSVFIISSCGGGGGGGSTPAPIVPQSMTGTTVDGYISNAQIFIDLNSNYTLDTNETAVTSAANGNFTLAYANGNLISFGGKDLDSQVDLTSLLLVNKLGGYSASKTFVTPVTTLDAFICSNTATACSGSGGSINSLLGIDSSININTFDPVANKGDGGIGDFLYEKGNQLTVLALGLQNVTNNLNTSTDTTESYFKAIAEELDKAFATSSKRVDIENPVFITNVVDNIVAAKSITISADDKANTIEALSSVLPIIQVKSSAALTTSIIRFATGTMQLDLVKIANGTRSDEMKGWYSSSGIVSYIATTESIEEDGLLPGIISLQDAANTAEDTAISISPLANDSFQTSLPVTLTASGQSNGSVSIASNILTYSPNTDFNGSDTITYTVSQGAATSSSEILVVVSPVNDLPVINVLSTLEVANGATRVANVSVSDVDTGDTLALTLAGTDAGSFELSDANLLSLKTAADYETKNSYSITLSLTDGNATVTKDITVSVVRPRIVGYEVVTSIDVIDTKE